MSRKDEKIAALIRHVPGSRHDPHYLGYFECFNQGLFYEAHDVLEALWLPSRKGPLDAFYKGLIQLAGAFVHLQKRRLRPADALFGLAEVNLAKYVPLHESLDVVAVLSEIQQWRAALREGGFEQNPLLLSRRPSPLLHLESQAT